MRIRIKAEDTLFAKLVKERASYRCECCLTYFPEGNRGGLECSHIWSRSKRSVRWHPLNAVAHCTGCHAHLGGNPIKFARWAEAHLGTEDFCRLEILAHQTQKFSKADIKDLRSDMRAELERMSDLRAQGCIGRIEFDLSRDAA